MAHYPPYTSKYNPIEHRLFCHVTRACKGAIFSSLEVVQSLINRTSTTKGLRVITSIKDKIYELGRKFSKSFKDNNSLIFDTELGEWNYTAIPQATKTDIIN
jgi:hypothetical protein